MPEGVGERRRAIDDRDQAFVGNGDDGIDAVAERLEAALRLNLALLSFEAERLGDDGNRERTEFAGQAGDHRRGAGAGAAAEAGGDEDHVGAVERLQDRLGVFERGLPPNVQVGAGAEALRQLAADLQLHRRRAGAQRLEIGVRHDELDAVESNLDHAVDGVAAAAADTDDFDTRAGALFFVEPQPQRCDGSSVVGIVTHPCLPLEEFALKNSLNNPRSRPATRTNAPAPTGARADSPTSVPVAVQHQPDAGRERRAVDVIGQAADAARAAAPDRAGRKSARRSRACRRESRRRR